MSYEEKGSWVYIVVTVSTYLVYLVIIVQRLTTTPDAEVAYVSLMLWSIGISIGLAIVGRIAVEIARPSESLRPDPRDKDINRFGEYVGGSVLAVGMVAPFILTLMESDYFWIANVMYAVFAVSTVVGTAAKLVAYRRGL